ncbi:hypothetical protein AXF42_Ash017906 [Apostasia shenzhenica]|uniref:Uncharacterized protein n=1 Tax=Apostasia shenzhenica TaxID=1088818 RepID=A0A2I0AY79_9ASPA|nr:hypothetical protein AXF42_Ash017906 [Apostasia shenzhenica]
MQTKTIYTLKETNQVFAKLNYVDIAFVSFDDVPVEGQNLILTEKMGTDCCGILMFLVVSYFVAVAGCFQQSLELVAGFWLQAAVVLLDAMILSADVDAGAVCRLFCCDAGWDASCRLL